MCCVHINVSTCILQDLLDYEVDSDDEWEEEDPGESLSHSEVRRCSMLPVLDASILCVPHTVLVCLSPHPQNEEDSGEDSEEDDGFFVPHGYLSEGEGEESDGEVANAADNVS